MAKKRVAAPQPQLDLVSALREHVASAKTGFAHDRQKSVGASEVGGCLRKTAYSKLGLAPDPEYSETVGFTWRGTVIEDHVTVPMLRRAVEKMGGKLLYAGQSDQVTFSMSGAPLTVTPDALAVGVSRAALAPYGVPDLGPSLAFPVEMKSIDPRVNEAKLPRHKNLIQLQAQMGVIRRATEYKPDFGLLLYTDASDYERMKGFAVAYDDDTFKGILSRAKKAMSVDDPGQIAPEGKVDGGDECRTCPYSKQCLGFLPWLAKGDTAIKDKKLEKAIKVLGGQILDKEAEIEANKKALAEAEMQMYAALSTAKTRFAKIGGLTVVAKETKPQNRYDTKAMAARLKELGDDPEQYKSPTKPGASLVVERQ